MKISANPQQAHLVPGFRLDDRYELLYPYAQGGMATVWVARVQGKHGFEKLVAVKTILPHLARDRGFRAMFLDEASIASRIRHPNVADILDLGEEADTLYMVIEWINGDSWSKLNTVVTQSGHVFPHDLLLRIAADACAGLHAAHELRDETGGTLAVVHRDVSPQNILISIAGVTKVIDFGIAKAVDRTSEITKTGLLKGKAQYAAPEQVRGRDIDRRSDIWAMGTILYQFLSGRLPYPGNSDLEMLQGLISGRPPPPLPSMVPHAVGSVVMTALAHVPEQRFQSALDMQRALEAAMSSPINATDVAAFMARHLADRIEMRRRDLADALAEAEQRSGRPKGPRQRLGTFPELARPAVLDQVLGHAEVPQVPPSPPAPDPLPSPAEVRPPLLGDADDAIPTRARGGTSALLPVHWVIMGVAAVAPIVVWCLVLYVALYGPIGRANDVRGPAPAGSLQP